MFEVLLHTKCIYERSNKLQHALGQGNVARNPATEEEKTLLGQERCRLQLLISFQPHVRILRNFVARDATPEDGSESEAVLVWSINP